MKKKKNSMELTKKGGQLQTFLVEDKEENK